MYKDGIIHEDIKDANVLVKDGKFYLADFGGARIASNIDNFDSGTPTLSYCPLGDLAEMEDCKILGDREGVVRALHARDVYANGLAFSTC